MRISKCIFFSCRYNSIAKVRYETHFCFVVMESTEMQSTFALVNNIKFEDKIDIEDLVLPPKPTGTPIMEKIDIKEEPLDIDIIAVHERTKQSGFAGIRFENEDFPSNMENQISKLFEELDQLRVEKVKQLFEKYHKVNQYGDMNRTTVEMLENNLGVALF